MSRWAKGADAGIKNGVQICRDYRYNPQSEFVDGIALFALGFGSLHCLTPRKVRPLVGLFWRFGPLRQSL